VDVGGTMHYFVVVLEIIIFKREKRRPRQLTTSLHIVCGVLCIEQA
jgi:hypothetical protein